MNRKERRAQGKQDKRAEKQQPKKTGAAALVTPEALDAACTLLDNGFFYEARELFGILHDLAPKNLHLLDCYGQTLLLNDAPVMAEEIFNQLVSLSPHSATAQIGLADTARYLENAEKALQFLRTLDGRADLTVHNLNRIGYLYSTLNRKSEAVKYLQASIKRQPEQVGVYFALRDLKKFSADDAEVATLKTIARQQNKFSEHDRILLNFTLGKVFLDIKEEDQGFAAYAAGNLLKKQHSRQDMPALLCKYMDGIIELFNEDFVRKFKNAGSTISNRPIFIVGMPRSGSTLIDQILSSHSNVSSFGEKPLFHLSVPSVPNEEVPGIGVSISSGKTVSASITRVLLEAITPKALDQMGSNYLNATNVFAEAGTTRIVDKMLFNHIWVGLIRLTLPHAKIIHCLRDPVDIGLSIWKQLFESNIPWAYDQKEIGAYYNAYKRLMDHWHKLFPGEIHQVRYEDMVANQEQETRKLLAFCELPWEDGVLKFHENERVVQTASLLQVKKPIYTDSVKKWEKYEHYLQPLIQEVAKSGAYP